MRAKKPPKVYFSLRSPFSWMALRLLEERVPNAREVMEFVPWWDPDATTTSALQERDSGVHYTQMSKAKHLYILQDVKRLSAKHDLDLAWPIDVDPWWELPHMAWLKARRLGFDKVFYDALTSARWEAGENICDPEVLHHVATSVGLDGELMVNAAHDPTIREEGTAAMASAYDDDVFGIPYFKLGRHRYWGLDRVDALLPTLAGSSDVPAATDITDVPALVLERVGGYDRDSAGGCG